MLTAQVPPVPDEPFLLSITGDLFFSSRIAGAARCLRRSPDDEEGVKLVTVIAVEKAGDHLASPHCRGVLLDLKLPRLDVVGIVDAYCGSRGEDAAQCAATVLAYGPHVHKQQLQAAREAGCVVVTHARLDVEVNDLMAAMWKGETPRLRSNRREEVA